MRLLQSLVEMFQRRTSGYSAGITPVALIVGPQACLPDLSPPGCRLLRAGDLPEAQALLLRHQVGLVLIDRDAPGADWRRAVTALAGAPSRPCVVLLSDSPNAELWEQVTARGGYEVLRKPVSADAAVRTIRAGLSLWRSRRQLDPAQPLPHRR